MGEVKFQCDSCIHNMGASSCGGCTTNVIESVKKLALNVDIGEASAEKTLDDQIEYKKYACKVVYNHPEDLAVVNPLDCKYFMPNYYGFQTK